MQFWTQLFKHLLNKTAGVSLETFWTGILYCSIRFTNHKYIEFFFLLFKINAKYILSSAVKNQCFHECVARVYLLIF